MEFKVGLIQNPLPLNDPKSDSESLKFDFIFSHKAFTDSRQTIRAVANVKRKSSDLDLKGLLLYESINSDIKLEGSVNYAKNKQASVKAFWSHPRTTLEYIKGDLNITLPTFTPMTLSVEVNEVHNREYKVKQPLLILIFFLIMYYFSLLLAEPLLVIIAPMRWVFINIAVQPYLQTIT